ncbi:g5790 [Coccomyxa elongata]
MSEGNDQLSPESVQVRVEEPRRSCPKGSTAAAFHGVSQEALTYYEKLVVVHHNSNSSLSLHFNLRQRSHCALVYYEDANSDEQELAYADLLYCYSLHGGDVYIEHGYLFDTEDLEQHPMGQVFLESCQLANNELVDSPGIYHSLATVIEGEFWLTSRKRAQISEHSTGHKDNTTLIFFCNKAWDRDTGQRICVSRHKVKAAKQFVRG